MNRLVTCNSSRIFKVRLPNRHIIRKQHDYIGKTTSGDTLSIWLKQSQPPKFSALNQDEKTDVIIVGAGISGLTVFLLF